MSDQDETLEVLQRAQGGDASALGGLLAGLRGPLVRMARVRIDPRMQGRLDASDVVQEACLEAHRRLDEYLQDPKVPFRLWMRLLTGQKILELERRHFGAQKRDARREVRIEPAVPRADSSLVAMELSAHLTSPSGAVERDEIRRQVLEVLDDLDDLDREILVLRHFEQLGNADAAAELGIKPDAASKRYLRALMRLGKALKK